MTKLMNKNNQRAEPVQEQPKLSKEEYAAMKKAEREELWARLDTLTTDVFKDAKSLCSFLDFAAQCSPERIENLLLFHADAPDVTWLKTFDEWKEAGRSVRSGAVGYTALIGQDYEREDGTMASGYYVGKKFDVSQTRGRQPDQAPVYAADELVTAFFESSPVRIIVSEELPEGVQAQYVAKNRAIFVRNNMSAETTFLAIAREQAAASFDIHDGQYSRNAYTPQSYCATYVAAKKYGLNVSSFSFERVCQLCSGLEPQVQRRFLSDAKQCALPGFVDSKNEEKTERNAGYLVVSQSGGGMLRQGTREGIRRTPANRGMRAHRIVKGLDISEDVCHGMCP